MTGRNKSSAKIHTLNPMPEWVWDSWGSWQFAGCRHLQIQNTCVGTRFHLLSPMSLFQIHVGRCWLPNSKNCSIACVNLAVPDSLGYFKPGCLQLLCACSRSFAHFLLRSNELYCAQLRSFCFRPHFERPRLVVPEFHFVLKWIRAIATWSFSERIG